MITDLKIKEIRLEVRNICSNMNYDCTFFYSLGCFKVYARLNRFGNPVITEILISRLNSVSCVNFVSVAVDDDNNLYALFDIEEDV